MGSQQQLDPQVMKHLMAMDPLMWIDVNKLRLGGGHYELEGHEYQIDILRCDARQQCCIKGAQMGITEVWVLKTLHGMIHNKYPKGALYLFPTRDDVGDFSKSRFDPLISDNPCIGSKVHSTDSKNIKRIGKGVLYLRGARATKSIGTSKKSSSQLKSIPVDRIVFDERDEMTRDMVTLAEERVSHSKVQELMYLGTPTIPDYGIDKQYQNSDQRVWVIKCTKCNHDTCLELEFPECIHFDSKKKEWFRACSRCGAKIYPQNGQWIARKPDKSDEMVGWWISQLNSIFIDPGKILDLYNNPPDDDLSEVMNSKLGRAYTPAENRLDPQSVWACASRDNMAVRHDGPTCMGVDVGKILNVVIAERPNRSSLKVIKICEVESFNDLHDLAKRYNVRCTVIDYKPEIRKVREFQASESHQVFACDYVERKTGQAAWDERDGFVKVNRTEICDATHELVINPGRLTLPRRNQVVEKFVHQMCNLIKVLLEDKLIGSKEFRYQRTGDDHYRHALNYCLLASERIGIASDRHIMKSHLRRRKSAYSWMGA
jgi:hypothetical protein